MNDAIRYVDKMAGLAMQGLLSYKTSATYKDIAVKAYNMAYAMMAEKERRANPPVENPLGTPSANPLLKGESQ